MNERTVCIHCSSDKLRHYSKAVFGTSLILGGLVVALFFWWLVIPIVMLPIMVIGGLVYFKLGRELYICKSCNKKFTDKDLNTKSMS